MDAVTTPDFARMDAAGQAEGPYGWLERLAFAAGAVIMLGIVGASIWMAVGNETTLGDASHTQEIRARTVDLLEAVTSAETGQRGFLLTGKPRYLQPYDQAVIHVPQLLATLEAWEGADPGFQALRASIGSKMQELARTVALTQAGQRDAALAIVTSDHGQSLMEDIRAQAAALTDQQRRSLIKDIHASRTGARALVIVDTAAFVLLTLLSVFVASSVGRNVLRLRQTRAALEAANAELAAGRDRLEAAVRIRTAELTLANEEIQRFAYIVSHDLRAPLLNIIGFTSELEVATQTLNGFVHEVAGRDMAAIPAHVRSASEEDLPEAIRFIQTSTAKMDRLINAILRLSREGRRVLTPEPLDMNDLLRKAADSLRHLADAVGAEIILQPVPPITSDRIAVDQVFSNLIDNALKYLVSGRQGRVSVAGRRDGPMTVYTVTDNGRGIASRDLARIFELFRRAGNQDRPGEGIGLAHVKALVRRLGGSIDCQSTLGEGSVFTVRLPAILTHTGNATT